MTEAVPARPKTLEWAFRATIVWAALTVVASLTLWTQQSTFRQVLVDNNNKLAADKRRDYSGSGSVLDRDLHQSLLYSTIQAVLVGAIIVGIALFVRRGRPWARWALAGFASILSIILPTGVGVITQIVYQLIIGYPMIYRITSVVAGLAAAAVLILLFLPDTRKYFRAQRDALRPAGTERPAPGAGGILGALFPRRPAARGGSAPASTTTPATSPTTPVERPTPPVSRPEKPRTATRPGSVKPKGSGAARSKSRQR